jgi:hypothetical protein
MSFRAYLAGSKHSVGQVDVRELRYAIEAASKLMGSMQLNDIILCDEQLNICAVLINKYPNQVVVHVTRDDGSCNYNYQHRVWGR